MEARKASGPVIPKKVVTTPLLVEVKRTSPLTLSLSRSHSSHSTKGLDPSIPDTTTGKRIVEKLRSDVKGLKNAIRRSRKSNSRY